ncbi:MAG TPA: hypothetical protein VE549_15390, partial [Myxococcaceae bacterium]|nr:hypothetical protein [Myxococcaceae bacterium]
MAEYNDQPRTAFAPLAAKPVQTYTPTPLDLITQTLRSAPAANEEIARQRIATLEREARALGNDPSAALVFHEIGLLWEDT